jgi:DAACS family dicarboxylate/amino acid:cation (Na+ or H+) symporter
MDMIPLIVFALLFGAALTLLPRDRRDTMTLWLETLADVMITIVGFAMKLAPYAVFCLVFIVTSRFGWELLAKLAAYVGIVVVGYLIQVGGLYPILLRWLAGRRPVEFFRRAMPIMVTAFSTSSSSATLPTSMRLAHSELGVRESVCGFVLPLGATMNMNGTALFEGAVVLFIAQIFGVNLSLGDQALVIGLCVLTSIGAAGVPGGSLPLLMIVMAQVGVPPDGLALVLGVDRLLDMGRTLVNVMGDVVCAACIENYERKIETRAA